MALKLITELDKKEAKKTMFSSGKRLVIFLTDLGRILIISIFLLLPWYLIKFTNKLNLPDALGASHEVVDFLLVLAVATTCLYGYYYIIRKFIIFFRNRLCNSQRGKTITMVAGSMFVIYVLYVDIPSSNTILDKIDVVATISIAIAALTLQYSLRSDGTKKQREEDIKKYLNVIISCYLEDIKVGANGIASSPDQNSKVSYRGQNILIEWSLGHFKSSNSSAINITIKKFPDESYADQKRGYQFIKYETKVGVEYLRCYRCYSSFRSKEIESDIRFPITVDYFYNGEWDEIMLSLYDILSQIKKKKETDKASEKNKIEDYVT